MALSDYGFDNNDIVINTPIEKVITGFLLAVNKVYRAITGNDSGNISTFLSSVSIRHFIISDSRYDYLRVAEQVMFYEGYSNINNVYKRCCYLNGTSGVFILYNATNDTTKLANRNIVLQDAVAQLIDDGFQTSILPFYYYNNDYLTAVEFESFYRVFAYPFFKDYFIQRLKYLSLLRIYTEYRNDYLDSAFIYEKSTTSQSSDNDVFIAYNNLQFSYIKDTFNAYFINIEVNRYNNYPDDKHFYINGIIKNVYILKSYIDNYILTYNDNLIYNKSDISQSTAYSGTDHLLDDDGIVFNGLWTRLDLSTVYSITYDSGNGFVTADCYKMDYGFNIENYIQQQLTRLNAVDVSSMFINSTYYCSWGFYDSNLRLTTISDGFDFSDI